MIPQTIPSAFVAVSAEIRACELEMAETERHLLRICNETRPAIADSQRTRSRDSAPFAFFIAAAAVITFAIVLKNARERFLRQRSNLRFTIPKSLTGGFDEILAETSNAFVRLYAHFFQ
jgi:hypothetical protein